MKLRKYQKVTEKLVEQENLFHKDSSVGFLEVTFYLELPRLWGLQAQLTLKFR
jgi:hypothetical protein